MLPQPENNSDIPEKLPKELVPMTERSYTFGNNTVSEYQPNVHLNPRSYVYRPKSLSMALRELEHHILMKRGKKVGIDVSKALNLNMDFKADVEIFKSLEYKRLPKLKTIELRNIEKLGIHFKRFFSYNASYVTDTFAINTGDCKGQKTLVSPFLRQMIDYFMWMADTYEPELESHHVTENKNSQQVNEKSEEDPDIKNDEEAKSENAENLEQKPQEEDQQETSAIVDELLGVDVLEEDKIDEKTEETNIIGPKEKIKEQISEVFEPVTSIVSQTPVPTEKIFLDNMHFAYGEFNKVFNSVR